jgi:hypothetical protein
VPAPHGQALALALFEVAAPHDSPQGVAGEHPPASFHLIVEVCKASEPPKPAEDLHERFELARVDVLPVTRDVPPAQARSRRRVVQHYLGRLGQVLAGPPRHEHGEHPVAAATARLMTPRWFVAPAMTVMRLLNASSLPRFAPGTRRRPGSRDRARAAPCTDRASRTPPRCRPSPYPVPCRTTRGNASLRCTSAWFPVEESPSGVTRARKGIR